MPARPQQGQCGVGRHEFLRSWKRFAGDHSPVTRPIHRGTRGARQVGDGVMVVDDDRTRVAADRNVEDPLLQPQVGLNALCAAAGLFRSSTSRTLRRPGDSWTISQVDRHFPRRKSRKRERPARYECSFETSGSTSSALTPASACRESFDESCQARRLRNLANHGRSRQPVDLDRCDVGEAQDAARRKDCQQPPVTEKHVAAGNAHDAIPAGDRGAAQTLRFICADQTHEFTTRFAPLSRRGSPPSPGRFGRGSSRNETIFASLWSRTRTTIRRCFRRRWTRMPISPTATTSNVADTISETVDMIDHSRNRVMKERHVEKLQTGSVRCCLADRRPRDVRQNVDRTAETLLYV